MNTTPRSTLEHCPWTLVKLSTNAKNLSSLSFREYEDKLGVVLVKTTGFLQFLLPPSTETLFFCLSFSLELKIHSNSTLSTMQWRMTVHTVCQFFWALKESLLRLLIWLFLISWAVVLFKTRFYIVNWANGSIFNKNIKHFSVYSEMWLSS